MSDWTFRPTTRRAHLAVWIGAFLVSGCAASGPGALPPRSAVGEPVIESWRSLDVAGWNERIEAGANETWSSSPIRITLELLEDDREAHAVSIRVVRAPGEALRSATVTVWRDGFLDDAVRGDWHRILYVRPPGGRWRVQEARRAFRCYRVEDPGIFAARPCP